MSLARTRSWEPALTPRQAAALGIPKDEYESAALYAQMIVKEHQDLGTSRDNWEPTLLQSGHLAEPFITDGNMQLAGRLERDADPLLDRARDLVENVKTDLADITEHARPITAPRGAKFSVPEAVQRVAEHGDAIEQDQADGRHHHQRVSKVFRWVAILAPWLEALGFLTFVTYYLNVPVFQPWQDWLGWSFAVTVVAVIIVGQTYLVRHAGNAHNHARESRANGSQHPAYHAATRRNRYLWATALTALAITSGMIWRGVAALGSASFGTTAIMIFVAAVTGLLLPALAYLGVALDGSSISRERDSLAADLDTDLDAYLDTISASRQDLTDAAEIRDRLTSKIFPDICNAVQDTVDAVYGLYGTVRLLIGGLSAKMPPKTPKTITVDAAGNPVGYIGTSIAGAGQVSLDPLFDRQRRLSEIESQRADLLNKIDALAAHPWSSSRT